MKSPTAQMPERYAQRGGGCSDPKALVKLAGAAGRPGAQGSLSIQGANGITTVQSIDKYVFRLNRFRSTDLFII